MVVEDKQNKKKYKIKIMGEELIVVGDISEEYINDLSKYINKIGEDIIKAYPRLPRRRIFGLAITNITDEYFKLKQNYRDKLVRCEQLEKENKYLKKENERIKKEFKDFQMARKGGRNN